MARAKKRRAVTARPAHRRPRPSSGPFVAPVPAALAVLLLLASLVPLARAGKQYPEEATWYWAFGSVGIAALVLLLSLIRSLVVQGLPQRCGAALMRPSAPVFATLAAATAGLLAATFAVYAFRQRATTSDEIAQLWQAKIVLTGRLSLPPDPNPEFFALENVIDSGRWYAQFPIGGSLVLVPGALIGAPWVVNPVLLAVAVLPLYWFGFRVDPYGNVHTVARALEYGVRYLSALNMSLMAWPIPALLIVITGLLAIRRATRWDVLLIALFLAQVCAYSSYSLVGEMLGPRFLYTALPTLLLILARTPFLVGERAGNEWQRVTLVTMLACMVVSWSIPWQRYSVLGLAKDTRNARLVLKTDIAGAVRRANIHRAVVFLHEPFGQRLARRLWGLGMSRSDAARLLDAADACSLLAAVRAAEENITLPPSGKQAMVVRDAAAFAPSRDAVEGGTPRIRISSLRSVTPTCRAELQADERITYAPFGPALPLEEIGSDGRLDGDVIYAAGLGDHNEVLRSRFRDRAWHRLTTEQAPTGEPRAMITRY